MNHPSQLSDEQRADLVAYLDGELDEAATVAVEQTLAENESVRREAELLARTGELLDVLPQPRASGEFTARTLSTIKVAELASRSGGRWLRHARRGAVVAVWAAGLAGAAAVGFLTTNRWIPDPSEQLVRELPLIENLDMYSEVESVEFLKQLEHSGLFDEDEEQDEP